MTCNGVNPCVGVLYVVAGFSPCQQVIAGLGYFLRTMGLSGKLYHEFHVFLVPDVHNGCSFPSSGSLVAFLEILDNHPEINMDIEEQKKNFLNLLRSTYKASLVARRNPLLVYIKKDADDSPERITITESILKKYGFGDKDFWEIICPSLEEEGYITFYDQYKLWWQDFHRNIPEYASLTARYHELQDTLPQGFWLAQEMAKSDFAKESLLRTPHRGTDGRSVREILADIEVVEKQIEEVMQRESGKYPHVFKVVSDKLFDTADIAARKKRVNFDGKRTVSYKEARHIFHAGDGKHGQTLRFFAALWENRQENAGTKQIRKGVLKSEADYAHLLGLQNDRGLYRKGTDSYKTIQSLIKALNKQFRDKKIPAIVHSAGGLLLVVKNPTEK